jgi:hypothetical protein
MSHRGDSGGLSGPAPLPAASGYPYILVMKAVAILALTMLHASCGAASIPDFETQSYPDFREESLVVDKSTDKDSFIAMLKKSGATNIISSEGFVSGRSVSAVTADFFEYVYLFRDGDYLGRIKVKFDEGMPPVHPFVKIVYGKGRFGILLVAENIRLKSKRVAQLILVEKGGKITHKSISLDNLIDSHDGLYDPYVGGENLGSGLIFSARDRAGNPWSLVYHLTVRDDKVLMEPKPQSFAYGCGCFTDWLDGMDSRDVFHMKAR